MRLAWHLKPNKASKSPKTFQFSIINLRARHATVLIISSGQNRRRTKQVTIVLSSTRARLSRSETHNFRLSNSPASEKRRLITRDYTFRGIYTVLCDRRQSGP